MRTSARSSYRTERTRAAPRRGGTVHGRPLRLLVSSHRLPVRHSSKTSQRSRGHDKVSGSKEKDSAVSSLHRPSARSASSAILLKDGTDLTADTLFPFSQVTLVQTARMLEAWGLEVEVVGIASTPSTVTSRRASGAGGTPQLDQRHAPIKPHRTDGLRPAVGTPPTSHRRVGQRRNEPVHRSTGSCHRKAAHQAPTTQGGFPLCPPADRQQPDTGATAPVGPGPGAAGPTTRKEGMN
ncbi:DUF6119 family protein [Streptomyces sp. NPDC088253]|uniref:DUF6119 family protein n=1 Tax=Streptomyces sp. NPDC088253 TaxID=3365846 RepID=UPI00382A7989